MIEVFTTKSIVFEDPNDGSITRTGSVKGFTHQVRDWCWKNRKDLIGKSFDIKFQK